MKQLTFAPRNHQLTNTQTWTPDSQWLVFDVRPSGASFTGKTIERVNVQTGAVEVLYTAPDGAHVGVVTVSPQTEKYVFIHGPENPDADWQYDFHHRRGVVTENGSTHNLDAMDITAPYTPGALRGGSHVHVFSPNGEFISFTYNDHVMHERSPALDLRNVGVAAPFGPVNPPCTHAREYGGSHWSVLVSRTTPAPVPGSDQINRAYEEGWVSNQQLAFIGDTLSLTGEKVPELFIVTLPHNEQGWKTAGDAPLQGTPDTLPAPPQGVVQQRLTFTHHKPFPGLVNVPRHWVRSHPQATQIAFLMRDDQGIVQLWLISPNGGEPRQLTQTTSGIQSAFNWHPSGKALGFVLENRIALCDAQRGEITFLTSDHANPPSADAVVFSPDGKKIAWMQDVDGFRQLWMTETGL
ncbi:WD40 repeat protein [Enterobacter sp. AG5470]|nr:WD40 repeat protein [Enterobacter sp. AG5470]